MSQLNDAVKYPYRLANSTNYYGQANKDLWNPTDGSKSVYDPCPIGWRVPAKENLIDKLTNISTNHWLSSYNVENDSQRWAFIVNGTSAYSSSQSLTNTLTIRCMREGEIKVPAEEEPTKVIKIKWVDGIINILGTVAERGYVDFSVSTYYLYDIVTTVLAHV